MSPQRYRLFREEDAQDLIEYTLLTALLAVGFIGGIRLLADGIIPFFDEVVAAFQGL